MNYINEFIACTSRLLESPLIFNKWSAIISMASILSRRCYYPSGYNYISPTIYAFFVGPSGIGKDQAAKFAIENIIEPILPQVIGPDIVSQSRLHILLSKNHLAATDRYGNTIDYSPITIVSSELESVTSLEDDFFALLIDLYDKQKHNYSTNKHADIIIHKPAITFLGNTNPESFEDFIKTRKIGQGMARRASFIYADQRFQVMTEYPDVNIPEIQERLIRLRLKATAMLRYVGAFSRSPEFLELWDINNKACIEKVHKDKTLNRHLQLYYNNRKIFVAKVAMLCCAARETAQVNVLADLEGFEPPMHITQDDYYAADELLQIGEESMLTLYSIVSKNPERKYEIMVIDWLKAGNLPRTTIMDRLGNEVDIMTAEKVMWGLEKKGITILNSNSNIIELASHQLSLDN